MAKKLKSSQQKRRGGVSAGEAGLLGGAETGGLRGNDSKFMKIDLKNETITIGGSKTGTALGRESGGFGAGEGGRLHGGSSSL